MSRKPISASQRWRPPDEILISAGTVAESLIVAARRGVGDEMTSLIDDLGLNVIPVTQASAQRIAQVYSRWGKGPHPAGLNLGDCFAYEVAKKTRLRVALRWR